MKHVIASLTIGVCLLLPSAGVVLAENLHLTSPSSVERDGQGTDWLECWQLMHARQGAGWFSRCARFCV